MHPKSYFNISVALSFALLLDCNSDEAPFWIVQNLLLGWLVLLQTGTLSLASKCWDVVANAAIASLDTQGKQQQPIRIHVLFQDYWPSVESVRDMRDYKGYTPKNEEWTDSHSPWGQLDVAPKVTGFPLYEGDSTGIHCQLWRPFKCNDW